MHRSAVLTALVVAAFAAFSAGTAIAATDPPPLPCAISDATHHFSSPAQTLQAAVNEASPGDLLRVQGFCYGDTVVTKDLTIGGVAVPPFSETGQHGPLPEALDGGGMPGSVLTILPRVHVSLFSMAIQNGTGGPGVFGSFGGGYTVGGGIDNAGSLTLAQVLITRNTASAGGGMYNEGGTFSVPNLSLITDNTATDPNSGGGGLYMGGGNGNLAELFINRNTATGHGGGIYFAGGTLTFSAFRISGNSPDNVFVP